MGRRAKYQTLQEKQAAKKMQKVHYEHTTKGRAARAKQNCTAYNVRQGYYPSPFNIQPPENLPAQLLDYARRDFFCSGRTSHHPVCPKLGLDLPPYQFVPPALALSGTVERVYIIAELHCHQWQWLIEEGYARYEAWADESTAAETTRRVEMELAYRLHAWSAEGVTRDGIVLEDRVKEVYVEWGAKVISVLAKELEFQTEGKYQSMYNAGRLPWQCMNAL